MIELTSILLEMILGFMKLSVSVWSVDPKPSVIDE